MSVFQLASVVTAHAWSPDRTRVAVCENEPDVIIYSNCQAPNVGSWKKEHILRQHSMVVVGIDWCASTNKLVTCSHDVNAFVWTYDQKSNSWEPKLSILRINRAALSCAWSPDGSKFAVASGSKVVPVCYYERNQDWWVSKMIKKHRSTVISVAWHPSSQLIASASCDFKCRVFSAFIPSNDKTAAKTTLCNLDSVEFGQLVTEFESGVNGGGWVEAVAWSPSGNGLCFAAHDSTVSFVSFASGQPVCTTVRTQSLPYTCLMYLSESVVVAAGFGFEPEMFQQESSTAWAFLGSADPSDSTGASAPGGGTPPGGKPSVMGSAFAASQKLWKKKVKEGTTSGDGTDKLKTMHHNIITSMSLYGDGFSTTGADGRLVLWPKAALKKNVGDLKL